MPRILYPANASQHFVSAPAHPIQSSKAAQYPRAKSTWHDTRKHCRFHAVLLFLQSSWFRPMSSSRLLFQDSKPHSLQLV
jgi:hypothetical protein